jgi:hypothetical protein
MLRRRVAAIVFAAGSLCAQGSDWQAFEGGRWREVTVPGGRAAGFQAVSAEVSGVRFTNACALERHLTNQIYLNGSGVTAGDVDGDGRCDLYFCGLDGANALYRNLGEWRFQDITAQAGVAWGEADATGAAFADAEGDGDLDLIVNSVGQGTRIFLNDGKGKFTTAGARSAPLRARLRAPSPHAVQCDRRPALRAAGVS